MARRIVFFGTPTFAVPSLSALLDSSDTVVAAVTQPDRPRGRGQKVRPEAVKVAREGGEGLRAVEAHFIEPLGSHDIVDLKVGERFLKARTPSGFVGAPGEAVWARLDVEQVHFFDATTGDVLDLEAARG